MQEVFENIIEKLEEQIRIEENIAKKESDGHPITHQYAANCMKVIEKFVKQEAEKFGTDTNIGSNGWIPCNSGVMPKECITKDEYTDPSEEVLVYIYYGENCVNNGYGVSRYWEHTKFHKNPWIDLKYGKENVIAWQPLPQPYQPKGE